jgi:hypothetical protein
VPWEQLLGPLGALAATLVAVAVLWKNHLESDTQRSRDKDAAIDYERAARKAAEDRLEAFREQMKASTDVLERAVELNERILARPSRGGPPREVDPGSRR